MTFDNSPSPPFYLTLSIQIADITISHRAGWVISNVHLKHILSLAKLFALHHEKTEVIYLVLWRQQGAAIVRF